MGPLKRRCSERVEASQQVAHATRCAGNYIVVTFTSGICLTMCVCVRVLHFNADLQKYTEKEREGEKGGEERKDTAGIAQSQRSRYNYAIYRLQYDLVQYD